MSYNKETGMYEGYIYKIWNDVNDKIYIGQTRVDIQTRWYRHKSDALSNRSDASIHRAIRKYGFDKFHIETIDKISSYEKEFLINKLNDLEISYIKKYNSTNKEFGYNISSGGIDHINNGRAVMIDQYDLFGNFIKTWESESSVADFYGISYSSIRDCCDGRARTIVGYIWRYRGDNFDLYPTTSVQKKKVKKFSVNGELIETYMSASDAARDVGCSRGEILNVCKGKKQTCRGFVWRYIDDEFNKFRVTYKTLKGVNIKKYDLYGNLIENYESISMAAKINNCSQTDIRRCCIGERKTCHGFVWRYEYDSFGKYPV